MNKKFHKHTPLMDFDPTIYVYGSFSPFKWIQDTEHYNKFNSTINYLSVDI